MARMFSAPGGAGPLAPPEYLTPRERVAFEKAPRMAEDPKRIRAREGGAGLVMDMVSSAEGTDRPDGYDLVYGYGRYRMPGSAPLTSLTLDQVDAAQTDMRGHGSPSTAFGRYQMTQRTRRGLQASSGLEGSAVATSSVQDRLMRELLHQKDGYDDYVSGRITPEAFQKQLAGQFESLAAGPDDYSAYDVNHKRVTSATPPSRKVKVRADGRTATVQSTLRAAKAEHDRFLQTDPYITQRIEDGYMPDMTRWR